MLIFNGGMHGTYLLNPKIVLKPMFSPFKTTQYPPIEDCCPSCRIPVGAPVEPVSSLVENVESNYMGEINGE